MARRVVLFASLFFVALASGGAFVVYLAYNPAGMSQAFYVETMQHAIRVMLPRSHDAVIRVYDETGAVIDTHEHAGEFKEW